MNCNIRVTAWVKNLKQWVPITSKSSKFKGATQHYVVKLPNQHVTFVHSTYRCRNYSRAKTIRGNMVSRLIIDFVLKLCDSYGSVLDWQWLLFPVISDKRSSTAANFVGSNMTFEVSKQLKWTIWRFDDVANQMSLRYLVFSFLGKKSLFDFFSSELTLKVRFWHF